MDLGNKTLNKLISKDFKASEEAADLIINKPDVEAFRILVSKAEFLFDFIKSKISKKLASKVNENNVLNLFSFLKYYSEDFSDFITNSFIKFETEELKEKIFKLLFDGSPEEKTYALEFFKISKDERIVPLAVEFSASDFSPLKNASIGLLFEYGEKEEFNKKIKILNSSSDDFEKAEAVEFLAIYGDKAAFDSVYDYFLQNENEITASNLLLIKNFSELIKENKEKEILEIYSVILQNFPDIVSFQEINYYLEEGLFEYLAESTENFAALLSFYLNNKINLVLNDDAYSIDLTKEDRKEAEKLKTKTDTFNQIFEKREILAESLRSDNKNENIIALEIMIEDEIFETDLIKELCLKTNCSEVMISCLNALKVLKEIDSPFLEKVKNKAENETVAAEIESYYS